jgi:hypothetical protein
LKSKRKIFSERNDKFYFFINDDKDEEEDDTMTMDMRNEINIHYGILCKYVK